MKPDVAQFLLMEINSKIQHGKRPHIDVKLKLKKIHEQVNRGRTLNEFDAAFLSDIHYKLTEPGRLKW